MQIIIKEKLAQNLFILIRSYCSSALYLTGQKARTTYAVVKPYLDLDDRIIDENLEENLQLRGLQLNLKHIKNLWEMYKMMEEQKMILQVTRTEIGKVITKLMKDENKYKDEISELKTRAKLIKNDYLNIRDYAYGLEETAASYILKLPNILHHDTPRAKETLIYSHLEKPHGRSQMYLQIARDKGFIKYLNSMVSYLINDAALFSEGLKNYITDQLDKLNYIQLSNTNFSRSVVLEGCGSDFTDAAHIFILDDPQEDKFNDLCRLHLTGGGSIYSFMAYFAKHSIQPSYFPIKLFTCSELYEPVEHSYNECEDYLKLAQYSVLTLFAATIDDNNSFNTMIQSIQEDIITLYKNLNFHFRVTYCPASELLRSESMRLSIQMYSNFLGRYIEVGYLSVFDTYLSKRLLFMYDSDKNRKFVKILSGTVFNFQKLFGCVLENTSVQNKLLLDNSIKSYII